MKTIKGSQVHCKQKTRYTETSHEAIYLLDQIPWNTEYCSELIPYTGDKNMILPNTTCRLTEVNAHDRPLVHCQHRCAYVYKWTTSVQLQCILEELEDHTGMNLVVVVIYNVYHWTPTSLHQLVDINLPGINVWS